MITIWTYSTLKSFIDQKEKINDACIIIIIVIVTIIIYPRTFTILHPLHQQLPPYT